MTIQENDVFRRLQTHLDAQAVGFPEASNGADLRLLKTAFSSEEAGLALFIKGSPKSSREILYEMGTAESAQAVEDRLEAMFLRGLIGRREKKGEVRWYLIPLVVGMFEAIGKDPPPRKLGAMLSYMRTPEWNRALEGTRPSQMRTIPIGKSIQVERLVARYDDARAIIRDSPGPFAVLPCICRDLAAKGGKPCAVATLKESCLGLGEGADTILRQGRGRGISREEALEILAQNKKDGLVLQPANAKVPEFICSCCGCCCGMLGYVKAMEHPLDHWAAAYQAAVDLESCTGCGACELRCQIGAIAMNGDTGRWRVDANRCIGCGLCATACPSNAIILEPRGRAEATPDNSEELYERIKQNRVKVGG